MSKFMVKFEGQEVEVSEGEYILGRSKEADIKFQGESVSRKHAKLTVMQDRIFIEDIGSSNGSFVNGKLVRGETLVQPEDRIHLGKVVVILKKIEESEEFTIINDCPNCHAKISPELNFCIQCGADLRKKIQAVASKVSDSTAELPRQKEAAKSEEPITDEHLKEALGLDKAPAAPPKKEVQKPQVIIQKPQPEIPIPQPVAPEPVSPAQPLQIQAVPIPVEAPPGEQRIRMEAFKAQRAGFWIRLVAYLIDSIILSVLNVALMLLTIVPYILIKGLSMSDLQGNPEALQSPVFILVVGLFILLATLCNLFYVLHGPAKKGGTPGKRILGLRIYTVEGQSPIGWGKAFLRFIGYMISGMILYIGFLMIAFREDKRGLHDLIAGTAVMKEK